MIHFHLNDGQIRDHLYETATLIQKACHFVNTLADSVELPANVDARSQLIDAALRLQATLANELDTMRKALVH